MVFSIGFHELPSAICHLSCKNGQLNTNIYSTHSYVLSDTIQHLFQALQELFRKALAKVPKR